MEEINIEQIANDAFDGMSDLQLIEKYGKSAINEYLRFIKR